MCSFYFNIFMNGTIKCSQNDESKTQQCWSWNFMKLTIWKYLWYQNSKYDLNLQHPMYWGKRYKKIWKSSANGTYMLLANNLDNFMILLIHNIDTWSYTWKVLRTGISDHAYLFSGSPQKIILLSYIILLKCFLGLVYLTL